jgi:cytoskeletal protein RodZ
MASVMRRAIDIDDTNSASQEERINALLLENRGLKEILAVHENIQRPKAISTSVNESATVKSTNLQTTSTTSQANSSSSSSSSPPLVTSESTPIIPSIEQDIPS